MFCLSLFFHHAFACFCLPLLLLLMLFLSHAAAVLLYCVVTCFFGIDAPSCPLLVAVLVLVRVRVRVG